MKYSKFLQQVGKIGIIVRISFAVSIILTFVLQYRGVISQSVYSVLQIAIFILFFIFTEFERTKKRR